MLDRLSPEVRLNVYENFTEDTYPDLSLKFQYSSPTHVRPFHRDPARALAFKGQFNISFSRTERKLTRRYQERIFDDSLDFIGLLRVNKLIRHEFAAHLTTKADLWMFSTEDPCRDCQLPESIASLLDEPWRSNIRVILVRSFPGGFNSPTIPLTLGFASLRSIKFTQPLRDEVEIRKTVIWPELPILDNLDLRVTDEAAMILTKEMTPFLEAADYGQSNVEWQNETAIGGFHAWLYPTKELKEDERETYRGSAAILTTTMKPDGSITYVARYSRTIDLVREKIAKGWISGPVGSEDLDN